MAITEISTVGMPHDEWLAIRQNSIGGSDASAIIGLNPYMSAYTLWAMKRGKTPPPEENEAMRIGHACSFLYARAAAAAKALGYWRIITYILESEDGTSLKAAGWIYHGITSGGTWDCPSRPREQKAPVCRKKRYIKYLGGDDNA